MSLGFMQFLKKVKYLQVTIVNSTESIIKVSWWTNSELIDEPGKKNI